MTAPIDCPKGYYCPAMTASTIGYTKIECPAGTYSSNLNIGLVTECTTCKVGHYCTGKDAVPVKCTKGFYCPLGQVKAEPEQTEYEMGNANNKGGKCPSGYFCLEGTAAPEPCPFGTYGKVIGDDGASVPKCLPCAPGYYCDETALRI